MAKDVFLDRDSIYNNLNDNSGLIIKKVLEVEEEVKRLKENQGEGGTDNPGTGISVIDGGSF